MILGVCFMFKSVSPYELNVNPFKAIDKEWMLITAGDENKYNTMTASWGGLGVIWNKPVATCYIRPQRYTNEFVDSNEYFTLSFFGDGNYRDALTLCGRKSGRDIDKAKETGLVPAFDKQAPYFEQAELVFVCRKLHKQRIAPEGFVDPAIENNYTNGDYHYLYIGEIVDCLVKD